MNKKDTFHGITSVLSYISSPDIAFIEKFLIIAFVLGYIISPIDLIPDVPIIGWIDDIGVGAFFVAFCNYRMNRIAASSEKENIENDEDVIDIQAKEIHPQTKSNETASEEKEPFFFHKTANNDKSGKRGF
jgi:uncharacterized membrane protein YkvA (DUF1232 family)